MTNTSKGEGSQHQNERRSCLREALVCLIAVSMSRMTMSFIMRDPLEESPVHPIMESSAVRESFHSDRS